MARYRFLAADLVSGVVREEIPFRSISMGHVRNGAGTFTAQVPMRHPKQVTTGKYGWRYGASYGTTARPPKVTRSILDPGRTLILMERDGKIVADAILWGGKPSAGGMLDCTGASLWSYFARRYITSDRLYPDVDQTLIAQDLIGWAQGAGSTGWGNAGDPAGNLNIGVDGAASGVVRYEDYHGQQLKNLAQAVEQLAGRQGGFDFDIDVAWNAGRTAMTRTFRTFYPRRGRRTNIVLELGTNIENYSLGVDAGSQAIRVHAVGAGEGFDMGRTTVTDASLLGAYPLTETVVTHKDADTLDKLVGHARARLAARRLPIVAPQLLHVRLGSQLQVGSWVTGDEVTLRIDDGWAQVDSIFRIDDWTLKVDTDGKETVDMTLVETESVT